MSHMQHEKQNIKRTRSSNIELLRIVAMMMDHRISYNDSLCISTAYRSVIVHKNE